MLINLETAFQEESSCLLAINFYNVESLAAILNAAKKSGRTAVAAFGEKYISRLPIEAAAGLVREYDRIFQIPIVLHLDHAKKMETIDRAIRLGFTSVMYDGSSLPLEQNIEMTKEVVRRAKRAGVSVEGELGGLNPEDGSEPKGSGKELFTDPRQAERFVQSTQVSALAVAVGNAHGLYQGKPQIDLERIGQIETAAQIPLVLHGGSGIPFPILKEAVKRGIRKLNVNTELAVGAAAAVREYVSQHQDETIRLESIMEYTQSTMETIVTGYWDGLGFSMPWVTRLPPNHAGAVNAQGFRIFFVQNPPIRFLGS